MTDRTTAPLLTGEMLAQSAGTGLVGAALSVERHRGALRALGLVLATGVGVWTGLASGGVVKPRTDESSEDAQQHAPPAVAAALGAGMFALTAGTSEVGLRLQGRFERWADDMFGRPRLVLGVATGAVSLGLDLAARAAERRSA